MAVVAGIVAAVVSLVSAAVTLFIKAPKPPKTELAELDGSQTIRRQLETGLKRRVLVGTRILGGAGGFDSSRGIDLEFGDRITVYTSVPITGFETLYLNGEPVTLSGDPLQGWTAVTSHFLGKPGAAIKGPVEGIIGDPPRAFFRLWDGSDNTTLGQELAAAYPDEFNATDRFEGCCVGWLICVNTDDDIGNEDDPESLQGKNYIPFRGFPKKRIKAHGSAICDPRNGGDYDDPSTWTSDRSVFANSGLVDGMFQHGWWGGPNRDRLIAGLGYAGDLDDIKDVTQIIANADYCDLHAFECHGVISSGSAKDGQRIRDTFNGILVEGLAKIRTIPEGARPHYGTVDFAQLGDAARITRFNEDGFATEIKNRTRTVYAEAQENYMDKELPALTKAEWVAADGGTIATLDVLLPFVDNALQAAKIEKPDLFTTRLPAVAEAENLPLRPFEDYLPGGTITIANSDVARLNGRTFQIESHEESKEGYISWTLREYSALAHDFTQDDVPNTTINLPVSRPPDYPPRPVGDPATFLRALTTVIGTSWVEDCEITAVASGSLIDINVSAHTRVYGDKAEVSLDAMTLTGQPVGAIIHLYYDDPLRAGVGEEGEPLVLQGSTSRLTASTTNANPARHYIGWIEAKDGKVGYPATLVTQVPDRVPEADNVGGYTASEIADQLARTTKEQLAEIVGDTVLENGTGLIDINDLIKAITIRRREDAARNGNENFDLGFTGWVSDTGAYLDAWPGSVESGSLVLTDGTPVTAENTPYEQEQGAEFARLIRGRANT